MVWRVGVQPPTQLRRDLEKHAWFVPSENDPCINRAPIAVQTGASAAPGSSDGLAGERLRTAVCKTARLSNCPAKPRGDSTQAAARATSTRKLASRSCPVVRRPSCLSGACAPGTSSSAHKTLTRMFLSVTQLAGKPA